MADAALTEILAGIYEPGSDGRRPPESLYGSLKMWEHLNRQGIPVARCTVERLMRANGWRGVTRARTVRTTIPDPAHTRAPDLVQRNFKAGRPGQLLVADFTYVPLHGGGFGYTAFCIDAFAGLIAGWECSLSKQTAFVERAIRQAAAFRARQGHPLDEAIHHSDAGSQYTSVRFAETLMLAGLAGSVGSVCFSRPCLAASRAWSISAQSRPSGVTAVMRSSTNWARPTARMSMPRLTRSRLLIAIADAHPSSASKPS